METPSEKFARIVREVEQGKTEPDKKADNSSFINPPVVSPKTEEAGVSHSSPASDIPKDRKLLTKEDLFSEEETEEVPEEKKVPEKERMPWGTVYVCEDCGAELEKNQEFCSKCGEAIVWR